MAVTPALKRDARPQKPQQLVTDTLPLYSISLVVAGVPYLFQEAAKVCTEFNTALAGLDDAGDDVGQHKARKRTVRNAIWYEVMINPARYNQRKIPVGLFPVTCLRVAMGQRALDQNRRVIPDGRFGLRHAVVQPRQGVQPLYPVPVVGVDPRRERRRVVSHTIVPPPCPLHQLFSCAAAISSAVRASRTPGHIRSTRTRGPSSESSCMSKMIRYTLVRLPYSRWRSGAPSSSASGITGQRAGMSASVRMAANRPVSQRAALAGATARIRSKAA